jgi:hypothetical protein
VSHINPINYIKHISDINDINLFKAKFEDSCISEKKRFEVHTKEIKQTSGKYEMNDINQIYIAHKEYYFTVK